MTTRTTLNFFSTTKSSTETQTSRKPLPSESRAKQVGISFFSSSKHLKNDTKNTPLSSEDEISEFSHDESSIDLVPQKKFSYLNAKKEIEEVDISEFSNSEIPARKSSQKIFDSIDLESESDEFYSPSLVSESDEHSNKKVLAHQSPQELLNHANLKSQTETFTSPLLKLDSDKADEFSDQYIYIPIFDSSDLSADEKSTRKRKPEDKSSKDDVIKKRRPNPSSCELSIDSEGDSPILASP